MNFKTVSDGELVRKLQAAKDGEIEASIKVLYHLIEFDNRSLFAPLGYSSLFDYATRKLGYSEGAAQRRIVAARCIRDNSELIGLLRTGEVTLCSLATAGNCIRANKTTVEEIRGKSKREVEIIVASKSPRKALPREVIKPVAVAATPLPIFDFSPQPLQERYELKFSVSKETYLKFEKAKALLSHSCANSVEGVFSKLLKEFLKPRTRKLRRYRIDRRHVPIRVKEEVRARDNGCCTYISPDGTRCCESKYLHFDHITPFALGGKTEPSNLRLLCANHNQLMARTCFPKT